MNKLLLIDDEEKLRGLLARILTGEQFQVFEAPDGKSGLKKLEQHDIDVVLCDVKLPDFNGIELTQKIKSLYPCVEIILLTAYGNIPDGVKAIKSGAFDYLTKGDENERIIPLVHRALEKVGLQKRVSQLEKQIDERFSFDSIIAHSKSIQVSVDLAKKVAATDTTVLLTGETGSGKEIFAQAIHQSGPRSKKPFVAINCSAFTRELLESEMFGHKAGSFTGAHKDKKGLFEEAHTGTIFLDEVGEMSLELQAKLLRVIENGEFIRIGESKATKINVRIIAATNRNLQQEIEKGLFRMDLFYRLSVFQIHLPPLRERVPDIEPLALFFASVFAAKTNKKNLAPDNDFIEVLKAHSWPGNIRELKNLMERSVILATGNALTTDTLPPEIKKPVVSGKTLSAFDLASAEKLHIQKVLNYTNGNKTEAARLLNIALTTLYRKLEEYHIH